MNHARISARRSRSERPRLMRLINICQFHGRKLTAPRVNPSLNVSARFVISQCPTDDYHAVARADDDHSTIVYFHLHHLTGPGGHGTRCVRRAARGSTRCRLHPSREIQPNDYNASMRTIRELRRSGFHSAWSHDITLPRPMAAQVEWARVQDRTKRTSQQSYERLLTLSRIHAAAPR